MRSLRPRGGLWNHADFVKLWAGQSCWARSCPAHGSTAYNITQVSLRQAITPQRLQGRMNASMRWIVAGPAAADA